MNEHYDSRETRDPAAREREQFAALPTMIARAMDAPGWAKQLAALDPELVTSRAALSRLPVLRKADIAALQKQSPPFGGLNVTPPGKARRLLMSPGPVFEPEGEGGDVVAAAGPVGFVDQGPHRGAHRAGAGEQLGDLLLAELLVMR